MVRERTGSDLRAVLVTVFNSEGWGEDEKEITAVKYLAYTWHLSTK